MYMEGDCSKPENRQHRFPSLLGELASFSRASGSRLRTLAGARLRMVPVESSRPDKESSSQGPEVAGRSGDSHISALSTTPLSMYICTCVYPLT
ncbi:hypothetical protein CB1_000594008 [Camelus ferus]|nr:hypothetical protein CB1_000594008 [Camelus ferus]